MPTISRHVGGYAGWNGILLSFLLFFSCALHANPDNSVQIEKQGLEAFRAKDYKKAKRLFESLRKSDPNRSLSVYYLGAVALRQHHIEEAVRQWQIYQRLDPEGARARSVPSRLTLLVKSLRERQKKQEKQEKQETSPFKPGRVAVSSKTSGKQPQDAMFSQGIMALVAHDLSSVSGLTVEERTDGQQVLDQSSIDTSEARYIIQGNTSLTGKGLPDGAIGVVYAVSDVDRQVTATSKKEKTVRYLQKRDAIYLDETLKTAKGGALGIRMLDDTSFQLGKSTEAVLQKYDTLLDRGVFEATVNIGFFRYKSGKIGEMNQNREHATIKTPTAVIGIRGSELDGQVEQGGATTVVHRSGTLRISNFHRSGPSVLLTKPGTATSILSRSTPPKPLFRPAKPAITIFRNNLPPPPPARFEGKIQKQSDTFQMEAVILEKTEQGVKVLETIRQSGEVENLSVEQKNFSHRILEILNILEGGSLSPDAVIDTPHTENIEAMAAFAVGMQLLNEGDYSAAQQAFQKASALDPDFTLARQYALTTPSTDKTASQLAWITEQEILSPDKTEPPTEPSPLSEPPIGTADRPLNDLLDTTRRDVLQKSEEAKSALRDELSDGIQFNPNSTVELFKQFVVEKNMSMDDALITILRNSNNSDNNRLLLQQIPEAFSKKEAKSVLRKLKELGVGCP